MLTNIVEVCMAGGTGRSGPPGSRTGDATVSLTMGTLLATPLFYDFKRLFPYNMVGWFWKGTKRDGAGNDLQGVVSPRTLLVWMFEKRCSVSEVVRRAPMASQDSMRKDR